MVQLTTHPRVQRQASSRLARREDRAPGRRRQLGRVLAMLRRLRERGSRVQLIADEWTNSSEDIHLFASLGAADLVQVKCPDLGSLHHTVDAILDCHGRGVGPVLDGSCAETDRSARTTAHPGLETLVLAKPGRGVDEGLSILSIEMHRSVRLSRQFGAIGAQATLR